MRQKELEHALETTLGSIPFVSHVRVHLSSSSGDFWRSKASSSSASVILISDKPDRIEKEELKRLVSGAVSDVDENNVRVFVYRKGSEEASHQIKSEHEKNVSAELSTPRRVLIGVIMFVLGASTVVLGIGVIRYFRRRNMV